jgi:single-strand selective monofunctional uracil DNA glycosylase
VAGAQSLIAISRALAARVDALTFAPPTAYVYNPLVYARGPHEAYLRAYGEARGRVLLVGMNPGPFGMAQTGVPFGDVALVRDFLQIRGEVERPPREHAARPVLGFACARSEVSGTRLWGWARARFAVADAFFRRFFVLNYCPLAFLELGGRNRTPDKLPVAEQIDLFSACDRALSECVEALAPSLVVGVGAFAESRARAALGERVAIGTILHPSPANPRANAGWATLAEQQLVALGVDLRAASPP